jgi:hypothetical protein
MLIAPRHLAVCENKVAPLLRDRAAGLPDALVLRALANALVSGGDLIIAAARLRVPATAASIAVETAGVHYLR